MTTWSEVQRWKPSELRTVADELVRSRNQLLTLEEMIRDSAAPKEWHGEAADAASEQLRRYREELEDLVAGLSAVCGRIDGASDMAQANADAITTAEAIAAANEFIIDDSGAVIDVALVLGTPPHAFLARRAATKEELEDRVEQILVRAEQIDDELVEVMRDVMGGEIEDAGATTLAAAAFSGMLQGNTDVADPPKGGTPAQNAAWWDSLTKGERDWLIRHKPALIGNLDGIPVSARSEANLSRLPQLRQGLLSQLADQRAQLDHLTELGFDPDKKIRGLLESIGRLEGKLTALDKIDGMMYHGDLPIPERSLIALDLTGERARAAIGSGDVDNADYVGVYTPGMNSTVEGNLAEYVDDMDEVKRYSEDLLHAEDTPKSVAMVTWLDYEPPKADLGAWPEPKEGASAQRAIEGAERLSGFYDGLGASRSDNPAHITGVGHSYGSLTTGLALRESAAADAMVLQGSPGSGGELRYHDPDVRPDSSSVKVGDGNLYNMAAKDDTVAESGWHGGNPSQDPRLTQLETGAAVSQDGERLRESVGHTAYTVADDAKSTSEYNTAAIIIDRADLTIEK